MREPDRGARDRDGDGVAPRGRRLAADSAARATRRRWSSPRYLYKKVVETWNAEEFSKFEFPRIVKEDWPTIYKIKYDMADLLYFQQKWAECGPAFDAVVQENPQGAGSGRSRVRCGALLPEHLPGPTPEGRRQERERQPAGGRQGHQDKIGRRSTAPKEITDAQKAMVSVLQPVRLLHPPEQDRRGRAEAARRGQVRARRTLLRSAALGRGRRLLPRHRVRTTPTATSASTPRSSISRASTSSTFHGSPNRHSCIDDMIADVPKFIELYCSGDKMQKNEEQCTILTKVQCDIQRLKAQRIVEDADKGGNNALELYEKGGKAYFDLWEKYGEAPLREQPAAAVREAGRNRRERGASVPGRALRREGDPRAHDPAQPDLPDGEDGRSRRRRCTRSAATTRPSPSTTRPRTGTSATPRRTRSRKNADKALSDADRSAPRPRPGGPGGRGRQAIPEGLRQLERRPRRPQIAFAIGAHYADKEDWESARKALSGAMGDARQGAAGHPGPGARDARACAASHEDRRTRQKPSTPRFARSGVTVASLRPRSTRRTNPRARTSWPTGSARRSTRSARPSSSPPRRRRRRRSIRSRSPRTRAPATKDDVLKYIEKTAQAVGGRRSSRRSRTSTRSTRRSPSSSRCRRHAGSSPPGLAPGSCGVTSSTTSALRRSRRSGTKDAGDPWRSYYRASRRGVGASQGRQGEAGARNAASTTR